MATNAIIDVYCFGQEIGKLGFDEDQGKSFFQYSPDYLQSGRYKNLFPLLLKRVAPVQVFSQFGGETFRGLPPMIADSLPDLFGNIIFKTWVETSQENRKIGVLEQLAYVSNRGMGALEFKPSKNIPEGTTIDIEAISAVLKEVLANKQDAATVGLESEALLTIFKIGTSAGGARPKILVSEERSTGKIIPGDVVFSEDYNHYLVKLNLDEGGYNRELVEYCYYLTAVEVGIEMMASKLIDGKHFATTRFDRQNGQKKHTLTASGMAAWDFKDPKVSTYENLFDLAVFLKLSPKELQELFKRMIFNLVFCNIDDHLKNHSFIYNETLDNWNLSPAYDITYALNPMLNYTHFSRALAVNGKRTNINLADILGISDKYAIKNPEKIIKEVQNGIDFWQEKATELKIPAAIQNGIRKDFRLFV